MIGEILRQASARNGLFKSRLQNVMSFKVRSSQVLQALLPLIMTIICKWDGRVDIETSKGAR